VNRLMALLRKEWRSLVYSSGTFILGLLFLGMAGLAFWIGVGSCTFAPSAGSLGECFFNGELVWAILFLVAPLLGMRAFAEEWRSGSAELLLTSPARESELVTAKFTALLGAFALMWLPSIQFWLAWQRISGQTVGWGALAGGYLGVASIGAMLLAAALFSSAVCSHPAAAGMLALAIEVVWLSLGILMQWTAPTELRQMASRIAPASVMQGFAAGVVDLDAVAFTWGTTAAFLASTGAVLHLRRWR